MTETKISFEQKEEQLPASRRAPSYRPRANAMATLPFFDGRQSYEMGYDSDGQIMLLDGLDEEARLRDLKKKLKCSLSQIECVFDAITIKNTAHMLTHAEKLMKEMKHCHEEYQSIVGR